MKTCPLIGELHFTVKTSRSESACARTTHYSDSHILRISVVLAHILRTAQQFPHIHSPAQSTLTAQVRPRLLHSWIWTQTLRVASCQCRVTRQFLLLTLCHAVCDRCTLPRAVCDRCTLPRAFCDRCTLPRAFCDRCTLPHAFCDRCTLPRAFCDRCTWSCAVCDRCTLPRAVCDPKDSAEVPIDSIRRFFRLAVHDEYFKGLTTSQELLGPAPSLSPTACTHILTRSLCSMLVLMIIQ